jgi:hypothetical protein
MADGGMSFITGLAAGAVAAGFSGCAGAGLEGFSAAVGFASSSAMMRRIDAKISSIEGSWTFAGCVISDSTSSTPLDHDPIKSKCIMISSLCLSMIFSQKPAPTFPHHARASRIRNSCHFAARSPADFGFERTPATRHSSDVWLRSPFAGLPTRIKRASQPHSSAFYTKHDRICRFRICRPGFSSHKPDLSPDQAPPDTSRGIPLLLRAPKRRIPSTPNAARIALLPPGKVCHGND